jgi:hypothetical protein
MNDFVTPLRLLATLLILFVLLLWLVQYFQGLPLIGSFPGDIEIDLPRGSVYLPITTSVIFGLLLTVIAYAIQKINRK